MSQKFFVGVNFSGVKLLVGEKYWSLKNWSLLTGFLFIDKVYFKASTLFPSVSGAGVLFNVEALKCVTSCKVSFKRGTKFK